MSHNYVCVNWSKLLAICLQVAWNGNNCKYEFGGCNQNLLKYPRESLYKRDITSCTTTSVSLVIKDIILCYPPFPTKKLSLFTSIGSSRWTCYSILRPIEISVKFSKHLPEYCVCASKLGNRVRMIAAVYMFVGKHQDFFL